MQGRKVEATTDAAEVFRTAVKVAGVKEGFFVLPLDANGTVLCEPVMVSMGYEEGTTAVNPKDVFVAAFKAGADAIIVAHNHPSGDPTPSKADYDATVRLNDGANLVGLELIDHLIIGSADSASGFGFVSMAELLAE